MERKGKEYDEDGNLIFEGEYLNDNQWKSKKYDDNDNIKIEMIKKDELIKGYYNNDNQTSYEKTVFKE